MSLVSLTLALVFPRSQAAAPVRAPQAAPPARQDPLDAIPGFAWDPAQKGPLVMVVPGQRTPGKGLDEMGLKTAVVGGLTAIVPKEMTTVDSRPPDSPNLYEGLPQEAKVMYLMRSFDAGQWAQATSEGIGRENLRGEQLAVFDSILPNPLRYRTGRLADMDGRQGFRSEGEAKTMPDSDRERVRIRIVRELEMQIAIAHDGGYSAGELPEDEKPGTPMPTIEEDKQAEYGRTVLVKGPNVPKKSDLDLADPRLARVIPLVPGERIKPLLDRLGKATGLRFAVVKPFQYREVAERGGNALARDLLGAIALGLCGTFRRVGDAYVLTNDLVGMAAHQARIAVWEDACKKEVDARKDEWRRAVFTNPGFRQVRFHGTIADALTPEERDNLEKNDGPNGNPVFIPIAQASPVVQRSLKGLKDGLDVDREKVGLSSNVRYEILLPGMGRAWWRGWLDNVDQYARDPSPRGPSEMKPVAVPLDPKGGLAGLALRADSPAEARAAVLSAARHAAPALLLETRSPEALRAAVAAGKEAGVPVGLLLRPWALAPGERAADPDRTVAGEHGAGLAATKRGFDSLARYYTDVQAYDAPVREAIAPLDPATDAHVGAAATLAATPGLAQVAVLDLYPPGYAKEDSRSSGSYWYSTALDAYLAYGYTGALRAAHFAVKDVDPLDVESQMVRTEVDLNPAWNGGYNFPEGEEDWQRTKGDKSHARAARLASALLAASPGVPVRFPGEPPQTHLPPLRSVYLYDLKSADTLPVAPVDYGNLPQPADAAERTVVILDDADLDRRNRVAEVLARSLAKPNRPLFLDLTSVPPARSEAVLARWIKAK